MVEILAVLLVLGVVLEVHDDVGADAVLFAHADGVAVRAGGLPFIRLLDLMINSIYTHKEIFLREIISNASDAIDKLCYLSLTDDKVGLSRGDFRIEISVDKDARSLTVSDNGIGMDKEELENNLGVIASSGSYKFRQETAEKEDAGIDIIGQFGVGFYSAFMVAQDITVRTRKYGAEQAYEW